MPGMSQGHRPLSGVPEREDEEDTITEKAWHLSGFFFG